MSTSPPNPPRKEGATVPPKRGRIKAQIFESIAGTVSHVASRAGEELSRIRGGGSGGATSDSSTSTSTSTAPSPGRSAYGSDGYGDLS